MARCALLSIMNGADDRSRIARADASAFHIGADADSGGRGVAGDDQRKVSLGGPRGRIDVNRLDRDFCIRNRLSVRIGEVAGDGIAGPLQL
jgi:hypothetical protein